MVVGVMELHLVLYEGASLKDKRSVVKRIVHRCRNNFNIAAAEVDDQDRKDRATLGITAVGSDAVYVEGLLARVENFVDRLGLAELLEAPKTIETY